MRNFMSRYAMTITVLLMTLSGIDILKPGKGAWLQLALFIIMFVWAGVELLIGFTRKFEGIVLSNMAIKMARLFWPITVIYSWLDVRLGWTTLEIPDIVAFIFVMMCLVGLVIRIWAVVHLGKSFSYDVKIPEGRALITTGPYRVVRHPSYLGILILATLPGLIVGSLGGFIGMSFTTVIQTLLRIRNEDKVLEDGFGETFIKYKANTYALIPFVY